MLLSLYNPDKTPYSWSQEFRENLTIPKNAVVQLIRAFLPLKENILLGGSAAERTITLLANDDSATGGTHVVAAGTYSPNSLAHAITNGLRAINTAEEYNNIFALCSYDESKGYNPDAFTINVKSLSDTINKLYYVNWNDGTNFPDKEVNKRDTVVDECVPFQNYSDAVPPGRYLTLGLTTLEDAGDNSINSWAWCLNSKKGIDKEYYASPLTPDLAPLIPEPDYGTNVPYGAFSWKLHVIDEPCLFAGFETVPDLNAVGLGASAYNLWQSTGFMVVMRGDIGATTNQIHIYEDSGGLFSRIDDTAQTVVAQAGWRIGITVAASKNIEYWYHDGTSWKEIAIMAGVPRYQVSDTTNINMGFSQYRPTTGSAADAPVREVVSGYDFLGGNKEGQYLKLELGDSLRDEMGYVAAQLPAISDTSGGQDLAEITLLNNDQIPGEIVPVSSPHVNIAIENLPVRSWANTNPDSKMGLSSSKVIGTASRYDTDGNNVAVSAGDALVNIYPEPPIHLNNADEITLNRLDFRITNADGSLAEDLDVEQGLVLSIRPSPQ